MFVSRASLTLPKSLSPFRALHPLRVSTVQSRSDPFYVSRFFHTTPAPQFLDVCYDQVQTFIIGVHSISGLPWVASLPLTALIIRSVLVAPLAIVSYQAVRRRLALLPLASAWRHAVRLKVMKKAANLGPVVVDRMVEREMRSKVAALYSRHRCSLWRLYLPLLQLPIFLVVMESVRKMSGTAEGLLGLITKQFGDPVEKSGNDALDNVSQPTGSLQESLSQEGGLWFPDLLAPDPSLVLPFLLSGSLFANAHYQGRAKAGVTLGKRSRRITNILKILALAIGPATLQVPSAMLVYWISSSLFALGQTFLLEWYYPHQVPVTPCKPKPKQGSSRLAAKI
ncbi:Membrane insertase OXA1/ALB3/YidC [Lasallia pustulata]|uniref:Membrane insertase OXA1/ALB3/YidC n=2 Tax=Lasallia pustulata TaxID=136370 RepID=A0A1W5DDB2_9LECA|nr:Membrane insertase OXA1/ALB3/YidC [Lasallia pustulata]